MSQSIDKLISRLKSGNPESAVLGIVGEAMSEPLLIHPILGQAIANSYLQGNVSTDGNFDTDKLISSVNGAVSEEGYGQNGIPTYFIGNIAVMEVRGALTARTEHVPCQATPASYEAMKHETTKLMSNDNIDTIVMRMRSAGGVASQNSDIAEYINSQSGKGKRLVAVVDDYAYSAMFCIASGFDEIWVTRTSGVGSVGVVTYHVDQTEFNKKMGISVEYIFAGDKKVFGNPNETLSKEARNDIQSEVSRLYDMFTTTVSNNLGMAKSNVIDTQAGTFHGQQAIDMGFATDLGSFDDVISKYLNESYKSESRFSYYGQSELNKGITMEAQTEVIEAVLVTEESETNQSITKEQGDIEAKAETETETKTEAVDVALTKEQEQEKLAELEELAKSYELATEQKVAYELMVKTKCESAGLHTLTDTMIAANHDEETLSNLLIDLTANDNISIKSSTMPDGKNEGSKQKSIAASWDAAYKEV